MPRPGPVPILERIAWYPTAGWCTGGSDGSPLREIDVVPPLVPFLYPDGVLRSRQRRGAGRYAASAKGPRIPRERWPEIAAGARRQGLRAVARAHGVSHETVRSILRRVDEQRASA